MLLCACTCVHSAAFHSTNPLDHHQVVVDELNDVTYKEDFANSANYNQHVRGRSSFNVESLHRSTSTEKINQNDIKWSRDNKNNGGSSSETQRKIEEFMESFYLKSLRIEMQKSQILHSFPSNDLPISILAERDEMSSEAEREENNALNSVEVIDEDNDDDQEIINFVRQVGSSIEQNEFDTVENNNVDSEAAEDANAADGWLNNFRPVYRFIKGHMNKFMDELNEHRTKMERVWKQVQEERHALEMEEGDEPYDLSDFEREAEKREIIFLDEGKCVSSNMNRDLT